MKFVTLFPDIQNVHLTKGVGMIPFYMHKRFRYDAELIGYKNADSYDRLDQFVKGLKLRFLDRSRRIWKIDITVISFLFRESKQIDVLNLYHLKIESLVYGWIYKYLNPSGIVYLKLDIDLRMDIQKKGPSKSIKKWLLKRMDIISIETYKAFDFIKKQYLDSDQLVLFPTGMDDRGLDPQIEERISYSAKSNLMITVGRIGTEQKNSEMFLTALSGLDLMDWSVCFIGPISDDFNDKIDKFYDENPALIDKVRFIGEIQNRNELFDYMIRSKVFVSTSSWEGFGSALIESLYFGNYVITTDVESADDITGFGKFGDIIPKNDVNTLRMRLLRLINDEDLIKERFPKAKNHIRSSFLWYDLIEILNTKIDERKIRS